MLPSSHLKAHALHFRVCFAHWRWIQLNFDPSISVFSMRLAGLVNFCQLWPWSILNFQCILAVHPHSEWCHGLMDSRFPEVIFFRFFPNRHNFPFMLFTAYMNIRTKRWTRHHVWNNYIQEWNYFWPIKRFSRWNIRMINVCKRRSTVVWCC